MESIDFLADLLVDSGIITGDPKYCQTEVGKRAVDLYHLFEEAPSQVQFGHLQDLTLSQGTQIGTPSNYLRHLSTTAGILRGIVLALEKKHPALSLPEPDTAYAMGLMHDLNATFSDYQKSGQQSKEFDEFILAKHHGWKRMEVEVSMHSAYLESVKLMAQGRNFPKQDAYTAMIKVVQGAGPYSWTSLQSQFAGFMDGTENLPLMLLTIADYLSLDTPHFTAARFEEDFAVRSQDIMNRYYHNAVKESKLPSLLGQAHVHGGMERILRYKALISSLLAGKPAEIEPLKATKLFRTG